MNSQKMAQARGLSMRGYCRKYEQDVRSRLASGEMNGALLTLHTLKISWLQHERLVHLLVTCLVSVLFLFSIGLFLAIGTLLTLLLILIVAVLLAAYIRHYYFLENTVQAWYRLYDEMNAKNSRTP
ncbi:hypothetical protein AAFA46_00960 [Oscillospiraceae bacterium WX1]